MSSSVVIPPTSEPSGSHGADRYAAAVRAHLSDLPDDVVDDLTDGIEADLAEQAVENGTDDLEALLGPASSYAVAPG